ncbi:undecaprenyl-diphosphatase [Paucimonas lemoignei]|uniref:Undecaprenyl-diphosphatase n=1 Tax=Paucimonas lemoignei TaxID=29443 RepID=A0A4V2UIM2_PAULE|nr:phosphatase PAP2 family protein [Paucimonas lemoignei]TCS36500.1 undecaprenyl-diphosphatase [Paucimonas lemoignei]
MVAALAAFGLWFFIAMADEVLEGETGDFDHAVMLALRMPGDPSRPLGPAWLEEVARNITALGSIPVLSLLVIVTVLFLVLARRRWTALFILLSTSAGMATTFLLKYAFGRPRPDLFPHGDMVSTASFPSGHAMISALVYLTLAALVAGLTSSRTLKVYVMGVALILTVIIGISRVYLGVHWPTDVLAGWAAGAVWALIWWALAELVKFRRGGRA